MSHTGNLKTSTMYNRKLSENGLVKDLSAINLFSTLLGLPGFTTWTPSESLFADPALQPLMNLILPHPKSAEYCMLVYLVKNNQMTLLDKLKYLKHDSLTHKLSVISGQELIIRNPASPSWWTESVVEKSDKLWLPTKTVFLGSDMNCLKECVSTMGVKSWFSVKKTQSALDLNLKPKSYKRTYSASLMSSLPDKTVEGQLNSEKKKEATVNGIMKIRLYPTQHQKEKLQQIFNANRYAYNKIVEVIGDKLFDLNLKTPEFTLIKKHARRYVVKTDMRKMKSNNELNVSDDIINAPEEALDSGFRDVIKARKSTIALSKAMKDKTGKGFKLNKLKYRSKKYSYSETIEIKSRGVKQVENNGLFVKFWPEFFGPEKVKKADASGPPVKKRRTKIQIAEDKLKKENEEKHIEYMKQIRIMEPLPELISSIRLQKIKPNIYYLCIPVIKQTTPITTNKICSIDPGVRTMLTVFDPEDKQVYMIGNNVDELVKRSKIIDKMKSRLRNFKGKRNARYKLKKEMQFVQRKIKNMTHDMHHKTSKFLSDNYKTIIYPKFNVKGMCDKKYRNIGKDTARRMYLWAHYKFRELLKYKTALRGGKVVDCTEEYTSKTCSYCGRLNHALGASKTFKCPFCKYEVDRDVGAARNIYLKNHHLV